MLVTLLGDVAKNYIDLRGLQRRLAVAQDNLQAQQDTLDLTKIRFDAGLASDFDVAQAEGQGQNHRGADSDTADRFETDGVPDRYPARRAAGRCRGTNSRKTRQFPRCRRKRTSACPSICSGAVRTFVIAERQLAAATAQVGAATADLYPKFFLTGTIGLQSISASDWFSGPSRFWSIGPTITWPVFDAGRIRANIEIRNAQQEQALRLI